MSVNLVTALFLYYAQNKPGHNGLRDLKTKLGSPEYFVRDDFAVQMHAKEILPEDLLQRVVAEDIDPYPCQMFFHIGEFYLINNDPSKARDLFSRAVSDCDKYSLEFNFSRTELEWMDRN